jgi:ribosomal protein S26
MQVRRRARSRQKTDRGAKLYMLIYNCSTRQYSV